MEPTFEGWFTERLEKTVVYDIPVVPIPLEIVVIDGRIIVHNASMATCWKCLIKDHRN